MLTECRHVLSSGKKCKAPALRHSYFCYFHRNMREKRDAPRPHPTASFTLPTLEDDHSLLNALNAVCAAMSCGQIKRSDAGAYLSAVSIAARLIGRIAKDDVDPVRKLDYDDYGTELAENTDCCEPPDDCPDCKSRSLCEVYEMARTDPFAILPSRVPIPKQEPVDHESCKQSEANPGSEADRLRPFHQAAPDNDFANSVRAGSIAPARKLPPQSEPGSQCCKTRTSQTDSADSCPEDVRRKLS